jgi:methylated-DNA-[protein]-cysteine S-methyltransferase
MQMTDAQRQNIQESNERVRDDISLLRRAFAIPELLPAAVRAAATACAQNLIAPLIPCHRIIKTDGSLGRYGYGEPIKQQLLVFEGVSF